MDLAGREVDSFGDFADVLVDDGVEATLGEDVDQHRDRQGLVEDRVFGIHMGSARERVARNDRNEFCANESHHAREQLGVFQFVAVKPPHEFLPSMQRDLVRQRQGSQPLKRERVELQRTLILQLFENVLFDLLDR